MKLDEEIKLKNSPEGRLERISCLRALLQEHREDFYLLVRLALELVRLSHHGHALTIFLRVSPYNGRVEVH